MMANNVLDLMCRTGHVHIVQVNTVQQAMLFALLREIGILIN